MPYLDICIWTWNFYLIKSSHFCLCYAVLPGSQLRQDKEREVEWSAISQELKDASDFRIRFRSYEREGLTQVLHAFLWIYLAPVDLIQDWHSVSGLCISGQRLTGYFSHKATLKRNQCNNHRHLITKLWSWESLCQLGAPQMLTQYGQELPITSLMAQSLPQVALPETSRTFEHAGHCLAAFCMPVWSGRRLQVVWVFSNKGPN